MKLLEITDAVARIGGNTVLHGLSLSVSAGQIHAIMGPNGSGKSTLAKVISGHPDVELVSGSVRINGNDASELDPEERAHLGLFMGFQYPIEIPGVTNMEFLNVAVNSNRKQRGEEEMSTKAFMQKVRSLSADLNLPENFLRRGVNEGFSGGEKKHNEILQMLMLEPTIALLDETDSGLDVDALRTVSTGIKKLRSEHNATVLITHYQRMLNYVEPDFVHILADGKIVKAGDASLALDVEANGFSWLKH